MAGGIQQIVPRGCGLVYIPITKCACTSVKRALYELEHQRPYQPTPDSESNGLSIHGFYNQREDLWTSVARLRSMQGVVRFAVVRDPVEKLVSCYRHRVVGQGCLHRVQRAVNRRGLPLDPDINTFCLNLPGYRKASGSIRHHSRHQSDFLGGTLDYLDRIFPLERLEQLQEMLSEKFPGTVIPKENSSSGESGLADLTEEALNAAIGYYRKDYKLLQDLYSPEKIFDKWR